MKYILFIALKAIAELSSPMDQKYLEQEVIPAPTENKAEVLMILEKYPRNKNSRKSK